MNNDTTAYNKTALLVLYTTTDTIKSYYTNLIGSLNPDDVNVVKILKGNNAAELFGAEAKNGALLMYMKQTFKSDSSKIDLDRLLKNFNPNLPVYLDSCYIKYPNAFYLKKNEIKSISDNIEKSSGIIYINVLTYNNINEIKKGN